MTKIVDFVSFNTTIPALLDTLSVHRRVADEKSIVIKPNCITASPFPVTTDPACCEAIIRYLQRHTGAKIFIAEGCGAPQYTTRYVFDNLGFTAMAKRCNVRLIDCNREKSVKIDRDDCEVFPSLYLPRLILDSYIISVPVLKAHSLAEFTGSMKNMMGVLPPKRYQKEGCWKMSVLHDNMHQAIIELNRYVHADCTVMDARVGLCEYHLGGARCDPPVKKIVAGYDPLDVDRKSAELLGLKWKNIPHLAYGRSM
jgi:uncharacterized protein (DUF362 family)